MDSSLSGDPHSKGPEIHLKGGGSDNSEKKGDLAEGWMLLTLRGTSLLQ